MDGVTRGLREQLLQKEQTLKSKDEYIVQLKEMLNSIRVCIVPIPIDNVAPKKLVSRAKWMRESNFVLINILNQCSSNNKEFFKKTLKFQL